MLCYHSTKETQRLQTISSNLPNSFLKVLSALVMAELLKFYPHNHPVWRILSCWFWINEPSSAHRPRSCTDVSTVGTCQHGCTLCTHPVHYNTETLYSYRCLHSQYMSAWLYTLYTPCPLQYRNTLFIQKEPSNVRYSTLLAMFSVCNKHTLSVF